MILQIAVEMSSGFVVIGPSLHFIHDGTNPETAWHAQIGAEGFRRRLAIRLHVNAQPAVMVELFRAASVALPYAYFGHG